MKGIRVKNITIGEGIPKICIPIVSVTKEDIIKDAEQIKSTNADIVEWRVDWFEKNSDPQAILAVLAALVPALGSIPLLFTFRTAREGGNTAIKTADYVSLNKTVIASKLIDLVDVEVFSGDEAVSAIITAAHESGIKVICSNHDFNKTPAQDDLIYRLRKMQDLGADILKIAVMPKTKLDVLELLSATVRIQQYTDKPVITMSMSETGMISRATGEIFGSALTFGSMNKASAPGQIQSGELYKLLQLIHQDLVTQ